MQLSCVISKFCCDSTEVYSLLSRTYIVLAIRSFVVVFFFSNVCSFCVSLFFNLFYFFLGQGCGEQSRAGYSLR